MPKAPRENDSATPKKRVRKTTPKAGNGAHVDNGNGASAQSVTVSPEVAHESRVASGIEEAHPRDLPLRHFRIIAAAR